MIKKETLKGNPITPGIEQYGEIKNWYHNLALSEDGQRIIISTYFRHTDPKAPPGHVDVFQWTGEDWEQLGEPIKGKNIGDHFGNKVAISADGSRIVISANLAANRQGEVHIYDLDDKDQTWKEIKVFTADGVDRLGSDVDISDDGRRIALGAMFHNSGIVKIYEQRKSKWVLIGDLEGDSKNDEFGSAIDLSGDGKMIVVGAEEHLGPHGEKSTGQVKVFKYKGDNKWTQLGKDFYGLASGNYFGHLLCCSQNGQYFATGNQYASQGPTLKSTGEVQWFQQRNNAWERIGLPMEGKEKFDSYGLEVSLSRDGKRLAFTSGGSRGAIHVYDLNVTGEMWKLLLLIPSPGRKANFNYGMHTAFAKNGEIIAISNAVENKVYVYELPAQSADSVGTIEDQEVYVIEGASRYADTFLRVNGPQFPRPVQMAIWPDPLPEKELEEFLFRAYTTTKDIVQFESLKYPGYFLAKDSERIDPRYPRFNIKLLQPKDDQERNRTKFAVSGGYNSEPNSFSFLLASESEFFLTNTGGTLIMMKAGTWFGSFPETKEKVSFYLRKHE